MQKKENKTSLALNRVLKASSLVFIGLIISKILGYAYRIVVARYYGKEIYGLFLLGLMIVMFVTTIAEFGLSEGLIRYISFYRGKKDNEKIKTIFRSATKLVSLTSIVFLIALFFLSDYISNNLFHNPSLSIILKIFSLVIPFSLLSNLYLATIKSFEEIGWYSFIYNILQNVVKIGALALLIVIGIGSENAVIISFISGIIAMFIVARIFLKSKLSLVFEKSHKDKKLLQEVFSFSWPIMLSGVVSMFLFWIDTFSIGLFYGGDEGASLVGIYNAAVPLASLLLIAPEIILQLFLPLINKEFAQDNKGVIMGVSKQLSKWVSLVNIPILIVMLLFPGVIINFFFGQSYLAAETSLRILAVGLFISSISGVFRGLITMSGKSKFIFYTLLGTGVFNGLLNFLLIPRFGLAGAATATTTAYLLLTLAFLFESKRLVGFWAIKRDMIKIFLVALIPTVLLLLAKNFFPVNLLSLILLGFFFVIIYAIMIIKTKCLDEEDIRVVSVFLRKVNPKNLNPNSVFRRVRGDEQNLL